MNIKLEYKLYLHKVGSTNLNKTYKISSFVLSTQKSSEDTALFLLAGGTDGIEVISSPAANREGAAFAALSAVLAVHLSHVSVHRPRIV